MSEPSQVNRWLSVARTNLLGYFGTHTRQRLARGAFWGGVAFAVSRGVAIVVSFLLARILGQVGFGEYGMINTTAGMIGGMAGLGIGTTVVKHIAEFKTSDPEKASRILALSSGITWISSLLYAGMVVVLAPWIAARALAAPQLGPMLRISAFTMAFMVINGVQTSSLTGCEAFRTNTRLGIIGSLLQSGLVLAGAWRWGLSGAVWGMAGAMLVTVWLTRRAVVREWRKFHLCLRWRDAAREWRVLLDFSLPTFLAGISVGPVLWGCNALLANQPGGYEELGIYNAANQWQQVIQFLPGLMGMALLPILSEKYGQGDRQGSFSVMWKMVKLVAGIVLPLAILVSFLSPWIMRGYGESFVEGHWTVVLSVATAALSAMMTPVGHLISASGRMWIGFWMNAGWGAIMLLASWWMVRWGAEGLAAARLIAYLLHAVWTFGFVYAIKKRSGRIFST
jgi:O-antigen/teichoic acid export membrane protein